MAPKKTLPWQLRSLIGRSRPTRVRWKEVDRLIKEGLIPDAPEALGNHDTTESFITAIERQTRDDLRKMGQEANSPGARAANLALELNGILESINLLKPDAPRTAEQRRQEVLVNALWATYEDQFASALAIRIMCEASKQADMPLVEDIERLDDMTKAQRVRAIDLCHELRKVWPNKGRTKSDRSKWVVRSHLLKVLGCPLAANTLGVLHTTAKADGRI